MRSFLEKLPQGFYGKVNNIKVKLMPSDKKSVQIGDTEVYNTEAIYARIVGLLAAGQITLESVLNRELSPCPAALFEDTGDEN